MALTKDDPRWTIQMVHRLQDLKECPMEPQDMADLLRREFGIKWITTDGVIRKLQEIYFLDTLGYWDT